MNGNRVSSNQLTLTVSRNGPIITRQPRSLNFNRPTIDSNTLVVGRRVQQPPATISRESSTTSADLSPFPDPRSQPQETPYNNVYEPVRLTSKFHEERFSSHEVLIDLAMLPGAKEGDLAELEALESSSKKFYFIVKPLKDEKLDSLQQSQQSQQQQPKVSILSSTNLQLLMDLKPRSPVLVRLKHKKDAEADVIEIYLKDIHLSRGDMWNINSMMVGSCVHKSQRVSFLGESIRLSINGIYRNGRKVFSAYVGQNTKVVFRTESARLTFLIQLSKEMWDFEESGEVMFHKLVNSLFPKIFKKWQELGRHHLITIVLFTSVDTTTRRWRDLEPGERLTDTKDYYRVVVDQVNILLWSKIMSSLRFEFANFMKDIMLTEESTKYGSVKKIQGVFVPAVKGNMLELINLATTLVTDHFKDPDLRHTTNHFIMVTPSTGLFDVDFKLMMQTSRKMLAIDAALDIICLSQPPLHLVPLFRYKDFNFKTQHVVPSWVDVSFWNDSNQTINQWIPRCKIYEIQMMGVMENEISDSSIELLKPRGRQNKRLVDAMDDYDNDVFKVTESEISTNFAESSKPIISNSGSTDSIVPSYLKKKKSFESVSQLNFKPNLVTALNPISDATTSEDLVFGVTNSRSNITLFTSLLNLSKKPSSSTLIPTEFPKFLKSSSTKEESIKSDNSTIKTLKSFGLVSAKSNLPKSPQITATVPILSPQARIPETSATQIPSSAGSQPKSASSSFESLNGRFLSSSPSRIQSSMVNENTRALNTATQHQDTLRPWDIMWTPIENPSQAISQASIISLTNGRWEHVFPEKVKRRSIKWTSLSSPAALPITTTHFPSDFQTNFTFKLYDIILNTGVHDKINSGDLMRDMISLRLSLGFQIIVGEKINKVENKRKPGGDLNLLVKFIKHNKYEGSRIYMSLDDEIHRISIDFNNNINVQIYKRSNMESLTSGYDDNIEYFPKIRTRYDDEYCSSEINALANNPKKYNWNYLDQRLAGYDDSMDEESQVDYRIKYVVLPGDLPENPMVGFSSQENNDKLNPEETRLEGLRKLISTIYKGRYKSPEELRRKGNDRKEELTPEINFYTGNLFKFLREQSGSLDYFTKDSLFVDEDSLHLNYDIKLTHLLNLLQNPKQGINFVDRKWHWKTHQNCFLGLELVNWMLKNFDAILSKEDAVVFGNKLMQEKFFTHVENRHTFLDGHYFYKLNPEFIQENSLNSPISLEKADDSDVSSPNWFSKKDTKSPGLSDNDTSSKQSKTMMTPVLQSQEQDSLESRTNSIAGHTQTKQELKRVNLSRSLVFDVDPNKFSYKPELITVHYDRVHNLEHCFHIRLEWLNVTSKLIDDTVKSWSRLCERYGLRLVETPWNELLNIPQTNPFHSFVEIKLALNPWTDPEFNEGNGKIVLYENRFFYHIFLLEVSGFLLDNRAAVFFGGAEDFEVSYSWGKPMFKFAQYIHRTGAYIAEIKDDGELFLAPNNAYISRVNVLQTHKLSQNKPNTILNSQKVMLEFRQTCKNPEKLREIFKELLQRWEVRRDIDDALFNEFGN